MELLIQMKKIPFLLIYSRIVIAITIIYFTLFQKENSAIIIAVLMIIGLLTDVFDGIIARKLNVSSEKLRIWDSNVDQFFWISVIASVFYLRFPLIQSLYLPLSILLFLEISTYAVSYIKFKKPIATHTYLAKLWTITLLIFLLELLLNSTTHSFMLCFILGLLSRIEILAIVLILKKWTIDLPSIFTLRKLNRDN